MFRTWGALAWKWGTSMPISVSEAIAVCFAPKMLKNMLILVTRFQTKPDVPWCSLGVASLLKKTSRWLLKEIQRHPARATVQTGHRSRGESGWRENHARLMAVELLMVAYGSQSYYTCAPGGDWQGRLGEQTKVWPFVASRCWGW